MHLHLLNTILARHVTLAIPWFGADMRCILTGQKDWV
jgi:hypothetical protein